ncbi:entry exclusion lipoprotein TrbK [Pseudomonas sp. S12(2018)]|uniref:entry exclusion lipoprotein TrbK n=1 Tax=Pseudomonas sp. S12(2018) TaxID=2219664 RepID=UPI0034E940A4
MMATLLLISRLALFPRAVGEIIPASLLATGRVHIVGCFSDRDSCPPDNCSWRFTLHAWVSCQSVFFLSLLAASAAISAGCKEDAVDTAAYEPTTEHCQPNYLKSPPDNKAREDLVEKCMTGGSYKKSEPKTW